MAGHSPAQCVAIIELHSLQVVFSAGLLNGFLGYSTDELTEMATDCFRDMIDPEDQDKPASVLEFLHKQINTDRKCVSARLRSREGMYSTYQVDVFVCDRDEDGTPSKLFLTVKDIANHLELLDKLKDSQETISKLRYMNAHDVRGPVANLVGLLELFKPEYFQNDQAQELYQQLAVTVAKLDGVIHEINRSTNNSA